MEFELNPKELLNIIEGLNMKMAELNYYNDMHKDEPLWKFHKYYEEKIEEIEKTIEKIGSAYNEYLKEKGEIPF